jgi:hypothetical protein
LYVPTVEWEAVRDERPEAFLNDYAFEKLAIRDRHQFFYWERLVQVCGVPPRCRKPREAVIGSWVIVAHEREVVQECAICGSKPGVNNVSGNSWDCYHWYKDDKGQPTCGQCAAGGNYYRSVELAEALYSEEAVLVHTRGWNRPPHGYPLLPEQWRPV